MSASLSGSRSQQTFNKVMKVGANTLNYPQMEPYSISLLETGIIFVDICYIISDRTHASALNNYLRDFCSYRRGTDWECQNKELHHNKDCVTRMQPLLETRKGNFVEVNNLQ